MKLKLKQKLKKLERTSFGISIPELRKLAKQIAKTDYKMFIQKNDYSICSSTQLVQFNRQPILIGERINPTGKKLFKEALRNNDISYIINEGLKQEEAFCHVLDVNVGLPEIDETKMMVTMNVRSLWNFFRLRCCSRAQWEIRALAEEMLKLCKGVSPKLFANAGPACVAGPCPEGKMTCGKAREMRERFSK